VVVGASFGGLSVARTLRRLVPDAEIVLVERAPFFLFAPAQLRYLFGLTSLAKVARGYGSLGPSGFPLIRAGAVAIDRDRRRLVTAEGVVEYDYMILASGIRLAPEDVPGLAERPELNVCPYEGGPALVDLRERIARFQGGHVVITTPNGPYKCQPAPYEYAMWWASHITRRRLKGRVTLVDPRSRPVPPALASGLTEAMDAHADVLAYEPFTQVRSVDVRARTIETELGRLSFDILSIIPPNTTMEFVSGAGLGTPFVEVDLRTFRSLRDERIYAVGDTADTPYAKTAYTAMEAGRIAADSIAAGLGVKRPPPGPPANLCYPMVAPDRALRIETRWTVEADGSGATHVKVDGSVENTPTSANVRRRQAWERRALSMLFPP
jgi:NADH dehydrogenase FAD-containing subunit